MRSFLFFGLFICRLLFAEETDDAASENFNLGKCRVDSDCENNGWSDQQCVSVNTNRVGLKELSQCSPKPACAGMQPGFCPGFQYWSDLRYRQVQPICVLLEPQNCRGSTLNETNDTGDSATTVTKKVVDCQSIRVDGEERHVIYGCQDVDAYRATTFYPPSVVSEQVFGCIGNNSDGLCNGCGTCMPFDFNNATSYGCRCYEGFSGPFCEYVVNGNCQADNQCGPGRCNQKTKQCVCQSGYSGKKCELCSAGENSCFGNGKCSNGQCECLPGFTGKFCQNDEKGVPVPVNASKFDTESSSSSTHMLGSACALLSLLVWVFYFGL